MRIFGIELTPVNAALLALADLGDQFVDRVYPVNAEARRRIAAAATEFGDDTESEPPTGAFCGRCYRRIPDGGCTCKATERALTDDELVAD